jgi:hypothetical protein
MPFSRLVVLAFVGLSLIVNVAAVPVLSQIDVRTVVYF